MNRRDMVFETCLALLAVTGIVVGNFLVQRWWSAGQAVRVADAAADLGSVSDVSLTDRSADAKEFFPPQPLADRSSAAKSVRDLKRLEKLIAEQLPEASPDDRDVWLQQLQDLPFETAAGILEMRIQLGVLGVPDLSASKTEPDPAERLRSLNIGFSR